MIRKLARPMLASVYIADGADTVINSHAHVEGTQAVLKKIRTVLPRKYARKIPQDAEQVTRALGATKVGAGSMLALGKAPRLSAATLAVVSVPTILARHAFWETQDKEEKVARKQGFLTSVALLGGLAITSVDTAGKPGVKWRAEKAAQKANKQLQAALPTRSEQDKFAAAATENAQAFAATAKDWFDDASEKVADYADRVSDFVEDNRDDWRESAESARKSFTQAAESTSALIKDNSAEWLEKARENSKVARQGVVKAAAKAQDRADAALAEAQSKGGCQAKKAAKRASKLEDRARKAIEKAQKKVKDAL